MTNSAAACQLLLVVLFSLSLTGGLAAIQPHRCANAANKEKVQQLVSATRQCLAGKRVVLLGNSVTRHWLFLLADMLAGRFFNKRWSKGHERDAEQLACGKGHLHLEGHHCAAELGNSSTMRIDFYWQHAFYSQMLLESLATDQAPAPDVVIANMGLSDVYYDARRPSWEASLLNQSTHLAEALQALPGHPYVYWRTTTKLCPDVARKTSNAALFPQMNSWLKVSNAHMVSLLSPLPNVHIFDAWEATQDCRDYTDHVHHPEAATDHVLIFASRYCGAQVGQLTADICPHLASRFDGAGNVRPTPCVAQRAGQLNDTTAVLRRNRRRLDTSVSLPQSLC